MQTPIHDLQAFTLTNELDRVIVLSLDVMEMAGLIDHTFLQMQPSQRIYYFWYRVKKGLYRHCGQVREGCKGCIIRFRPMYKRHRVTTGLASHSALILFCSVRLWVLSILLEFILSGVLWIFKNSVLVYIYNFLTAIIKNNILYWYE